jgi:hypothetical protein
MALTGMHDVAKHRPISDLLTISKIVERLPAGIVAQVDRAVVMVGRYTTAATVTAVVY